MDPSRVDDLAVRLVTPLSRRRSVGLFGLLGLLGAASAVAPENVTARKKKKKKKKKTPPPPPPPPPPGGSCAVTVPPGADLQAAIDASNAGTTICLTAGTYPLDRGFGETHDLDLRSVNLRGVGPGQTILQGSGLRGVVECNSCGDTTLTGLTITGGNFGPLEGVGGGIAFTGELALITCSVTGNVAGDGGGIFIGNDSQLVLDRCTITNNTAHREELLTGSGGGVFNLGALTQTNTTISGNTSDVGPDCSGPGTGC